MARTPLLNKLIRLRRMTLSPGPSVDAQTRRRLLQGGAGAAALSLLPAWAQERARPLRIAIVGAGLAGLSCAYALKKQGVMATIYEAARRAGGRCSTNRTHFGAQSVEQGGEFIDSMHGEIRALAEELGLQLEDMHAHYERVGGEDICYLDGAPYITEDAFRDFRAVATQLDADADAAPFPTTWDNHTPRGRELDAMSIAGWITAYVPGGLRSRFGRMLELAYVTEYGAEIADQSALNLINLLGYSAEDKLQLLGESDERYWVRGGNDQIVSRMTRYIGKEHIALEHELTQIEQLGNASFILSFRKGDESIRTHADHVVLALPFAVLRRSVDYSAAGFDERKRLAIEKQPMGNNSKLHAQFKERYWRKQGSSGYSLSDTGYQSQWETTLAQPGKGGILTNFSGGKNAVAMNDAPLATKLKNFLAQYARVLPGAQQQATGKALLNYWPGHRWAQGSYSYYAPGDYIRFGGYEGVRQGNCHFCGEHTSIEAQGYLNGAVESGLRCAREIIGKPD